MREIVLNCGRAKCCPTVRIDEDQVSIKDDYDNEIYMNKSAFDDLKHRIKVGEFDQ